MKFTKKIYIPVFVVVLIAAIYMSGSFKSSFKAALCSFMVCKADTRFLENFVITNLQAQINASKELKETGLTVESALVLHQSGNQYKGIVRLARLGKLYEIIANIIVDKDNVMLEIPPGSFGFLISDQPTDFFKSAPPPTQNLPNIPGYKTL